ncbi:ABC transporter ATP-binding protein [Ktedonosporobacter rubrisoli]|uniref:ABC transporter ATP-binding protein n=1 Tax=Ktedonosporobacter rubrisoli TaxID=2509675 RepID=A0A4P6JMK1_KTERU|nr:ABC transporter ATP-binding protein [Ktedonosporobacter rubrisoli]QBD76464.1 ABC transporter ATP-binding protein [Ktedonosporobacter rubrisoli]
MYISPFKQEREDEAHSLKEQIRKWWRNLHGAVVGSARVFRLVWGTSPKLTIGMALVTILQALLPASTIYVNKLLLDTVEHAIVRHSEIALAIRTIIILAIVQLLLNLGGSLLSTLMNIFQQALQDRTSNHVQYLLIQHANTLDMAFFERSESYDKLHEVQREALYRPVNMISSTFGLIRSLGTFFSMVALLVQLRWFLAVLALLAPVPAFISDARYGWKGFKLARSQSPLRRMMYYLVNLLTIDDYHKEIKIFSLGDFFVARFKDLAQRFMQESQQLVTRRYLAGFFWGMLTTLTSSGTFLYVALEAIYAHISIGDLTLYTQAANSVQSNFQNVLSGLSSMYENNLYLSTLFEVLEMKQEIPVPAQPRPLERPFTQGIEFRNVTFRYEGKEEPALNNVSFKLKAGETLAIVGRNGAGKTTLVKLLTRLYDPQEGQILVNGHDIREYDPEDLRSEIGVIFQDFVHYQLNVQENIGVGRLEFIEDRVRTTQAAEKSGATEVVAKLPHGFDTVLGRWFEEGHQLSGGEWQKVALARGFMRDSQLLILDEPTAALDAKAEYDLFVRMRELTLNRTAIFISHRFSTVRQADHILVIERGHLIEQGSHEDLMTLDGRYAELFNLQALPYR